MRVCTRLAGGLCSAIIALTFTAAARAADADPKGAVPPEQATFTPVKETKILDPATGVYGYYVIYVPKDYTPEREWPAIFCYHGSGGVPTVWPFKELTDGQKGEDAMNHPGDWAKILAPRRSVNLIVVT